MAANLGVNCFILRDAKVLPSGHGEVASISGVLTFKDWLCIEEHNDLANHPEGENPLLVALGVSIGFEPDRDDAAWANATRLDIQLEPDHSLEQRLWLDEQPKDL